MTIAKLKLAVAVGTSILFVASVNAQSVDMKRHAPPTVRGIAIDNCSTLNTRHDCTGVGQQRAADGACKHLGHKRASNYLIGPAAGRKPKAYHLSVGEASDGTETTREWILLPTGATFAWVDCE